MKPIAYSSLAALAGCLISLNAHAVEPPKPGSVFKDCKNCPEMVVLPAGSFVMGTPEDEVGREPDEGPQHSVTFKNAFAMSRFHVTAAELDAYTVSYTHLTLPTILLV